MKRAEQKSRRPQLLVFAVACALLVLATTALQSAPHGAPASRESVPALAIHGVTLPAFLPDARVDCGKRPCLVLSFDDGPNPITTPQILGILEQYHAHADFFVVGLRAAAMPDILRREYRDGDEIGNHSWSHPDLTTLTPAQIHAQVDQTQAAVVAAGLPAPRLFRPPYGAVDPTVKSNVGLTIALWNIDPVDWSTTDPNQLIQKVTSEARPGSVLDLHDIDAITVSALPAILQNLTARFQLVTMSQLFDLQSAQPGEFFGR